jgi:hypothetical protein
VHLSPGVEPGLFVFGVEENCFYHRGRRVTAEVTETFAKRERVRMGKRMVWGILGILALVPFAVWAAPSQYTVTVTLNYDFTVDNGSSTTVTTGCLKQFNIYDITGGVRR